MTKTLSRICRRVPSICLTPFLRPLRAHTPVPQRVLGFVDPYLVTCNCSSTNIIANNLRILTHALVRVCSGAWDATRSQESMWSDTRLSENCLNSGRIQAPRLKTA